MQNELSRFAICLVNDLNELHSFRILKIRNERRSEGKAMVFDRLRRQAFS